MSILVFCRLLIHLHIGSNEPLLHMMETQLPDANSAHILSHMVSSTQGVVYYYTNTRTHRYLLLWYQLDHESPWTKYLLLICANSVFIWLLKQHFVLHIKPPLLSKMRLSEMQTAVLEDLIKRLVLYIDMIFSIYNRNIANRSFVGNSLG